jgi:hypothetical protein
MYVVRQLIPLCCTRLVPSNPISPLPLFPFIANSHLGLPFPSPSPTPNSESRPPSPYSECDTHKPHFIVYNAYHIFPKKATADDAMMPSCHIYHVKVLKNCFQMMPILHISKKGNCRCHQVIPSYIPHGSTQNLLSNDTNIIYFQKMQLLMMPSGDPVTCTM